MNDTLNQIRIDLNGKPLVNDSFLLLDVYSAIHFADYINSYTDINFYLRDQLNITYLYKRLKQLTRNVIVMAKEYILVDLDKNELDNYEKYYTEIGNLDFT